jgi:hypothetical protein
VVVGSGPPDRACVVHHGTDELLIQQHMVPDVQATLVKVGVNYTQSLSCLSPYLIDMCQPGQPYIKGYPKAVVFNQGYAKTS